MIIKKIFNDVCIINPVSFDDERGYFEEFYNYDNFRNLGIKEKFTQDNLSFSAKRGTIRGLHFQKDEYSQSKLLRVLKGEIQDVFIDLRKDSKTFAKYHSINLKEESGWIYIPKGYAHGFCTLTDNTKVMYKVDIPYSPSHDSGIRWNDNYFSINWSIGDQEPILSEKDNDLPFWKDIKNKISFSYG